MNEVISRIPAYFYKMASKTLRFYVNEKRVSTAVRTYDGYILQVYPMRQRFAEEEDWKTFWENHSVSKPRTHIDGLMEKEKAMTEKSKDNRFRCAVCLLGNDTDHRNCIVLKFKGNVQDWEDAGKMKEDTTTPRLSSLLAPSVLASLMEKETPPKKPYPIIRQEDWTFKEKSRTILPAGKYYIGDLCYVLHEDIYDKVFGGFGYDDGLYTEKEMGLSFFVGSTAYGDGLYKDDRNREYCVDAGIIGICPAELMYKDEDGDGGQVFTFTEPVSCRIKHGIFTFESGHQYVRINTAGSDDEEDY